MKLTVSTQPRGGDAPRVDYCWDPDTGILGARLCRDESEPLALACPPQPSPGIVQIMAPDGAWLHFEIVGGAMAALEIAIWPELERSRTLTLPRTDDGYAEVSFAAGQRRVDPGVVLGVTLPVKALPDFPSRAVQLCFGSARAHRAVRVADGLLIGTDRSGQLAAVWLQNVPGLGATDGRDG